MLFPKKTKKKKLSRSRMIKEADRVWSLYIRERDRGLPCITCGTPWTESQQAGHFMSRRHLNTRWEMHNGAGQCPKCNCWGAGEQYEFALALEKKSP
ncbi:MAG TPA: recombination protein NinG [Saccharofermentans sp.]|nr:recombination protein NinG [Saccharofermentans sp.]